MRRECTSWCLRIRRQERGDQVGRLMPFARFARELFSARRRERVVLRSAVVLRLLPLGLDEPLLLQLEQRGIQSAVVEREAIAAGFLDAARDTVAVERS